MSPNSQITCDVAVVGGGPGGAAAAYWLADAGHEVVLIEKKLYPREKTCGDGLTPRAVRQLQDMGVEGELDGAHRFDGLRSMGFGRTVELRWPDHPDFPVHGLVLTRHDLDGIVAGRATKAGAQLMAGHEAVSPLVEDGRCGGVLVRDRQDGCEREVRARYVVVADGSISRTARALGATRNRAYPQGMAIRGYYESPRHDEAWIESHLDIRDREGHVVPGYGWVFPVGDGRVNVGVGVLSTFSRWKSVNTSRLMDAFVDYAPDYWGLSPEASCGPPTGGRLPMGLSAGPVIGRGHVLVGDAAGAVNPFNGEGIAYAYETGRMAAFSVADALTGGGDEALLGYQARLESTYGLYYRVARVFVRLIGRPELMAVLAGTGMHSRTLMDWAMRIMANLLRSDETGPAEAAYRAMATLARSVR